MEQKDAIEADAGATGQLSRQAAEVYEAFFVPALFEAWAPRVAAAAGVGPGHRVLDVACGTGVLAREGWTLAEAIDDAAFARLVREAERALQRFVVAGGAVSFPAPAHIVTATLG